MPGYRTLDRYLCYRYTGQYEHERYLRGHYYSPLPDLAEVQSRAAVLFRDDVDLGPSIDLNPERQHLLLMELAQYYQDFQWPNEPSSNFRFYLNQTVFGPGDAVILHAMLRHFKPKRIIEAGSGFTSALMLDTDERFFQKEIQFTFVEPFPKRLLSIVRAGDLERCTVIRDKLQNVPLSIFQALKPNDVFFVDSSHVAKIGSDVNYILFEILPALKPGVVVHFHDVLWPFEYPLNWVVKGRAWNEAYMLRAFLEYNSKFEIILLNCFVGRLFTDFMKVNMPIFLRDTGGSLWIRKTP
jgi:hypothetical protein